VKNTEAFVTGAGPFNPGYRGRIVQVVFTCPSSPSANLATVALGAGNVGQALPPAQSAAGTVTGSLVAAWKAGAVGVGQSFDVNVPIMPDTWIHSVSDNGEVIIVIEKA